MSGDRLDALSLREMRERAESVLRVEESSLAMARSGLTPWARDVLALLDERERLEASLRLANEEIRIREESQIPVIPRGAQAEIERLAALLRDAEDARRQFLAAWTDASVSWCSGTHDDLGEAVARLAESERAPKAETVCLINGHGSYFHAADSCVPTCPKCESERAPKEAQ